MKFNAVLILAILLIANACPDQDPKPDSKITIKNNSNKPILNYFDFHKYPDTSIASYNYFSDQNQLELAVINPFDSVIQEGQFLEYFKHPETKKLMIFLFDKETVEQVAWATIRDKYLIIKRYDLTLEDLQLMSWTISYP